MLCQAGEILRSDKRRSGSTLELENGLEVLAVGDIHGHRKNFARVMRYWDLAGKPERCIVLQEIIHGPGDPVTGFDRSIELLMRSARSIIQYPGQFLFVLGNHDLSQIMGNEITKAGQGSCEAFAAGIYEEFGSGGDEILAAITEMLKAMPLAVRCAGGVMISHSLPSPHRMELAGTEILTRDYCLEDFRRGGSVYEWTWGRNLEPEQIESLAEEIGVVFFILGHQHVQSGYEKIGPRAVTITTDHSHGCVVQFMSGQAIDSDSMDSCVHRVASIGLS